MQRYIIQIAFLLQYCIFNIEADAIPYSYSSGRDVAAVESRYKLAQDAISRNAKLDLINICGKVDTTKRHCITTFGRPENSENLACDSMCCMTGSKIGNCGSNFGGVKLDRGRLLEVLFGIWGTGFPIPNNAIHVDLTTECFCSNDPLDVRCGRDGSVFGIHGCPFDKSACWRFCCRKGYEEGKCTKFAKYKCVCENKIY